MPAADLGVQRGLALLKRVVHVLALREQHVGHREVVHVGSAVGVREFPDHRCDGGGLRDGRFVVAADE